MKTARKLIVLSFILLSYGSCLPSQKPVQAEEDQNFKEEASARDGEVDDASAGPKATQLHEGMQPGGHIYGYGPAFQEPSPAPSQEVKK